MDIKRVLQTGVGGLRSHLSFGVCAVLATMLVAPQVGLGVLKLPSNAAAASATAPLAVRAPFGPAAPAPVIPPVVVVLSRVELVPIVLLTRSPLALPISFGQPVAPEDEASPPPARWHHKIAPRRARRLAHHTAAQTASALTALNNAAEAALGLPAAQGDDAGEADPQH